MKWFKSVLVLIFCVGLFNIVAAQPLPPPPQIYITEVMYHSPEMGSDSLDFIEIIGAYCSGSFNLEGFDFVGGIEFVFPSDAMIDCDGYVILAKDSVAFENTFGIPAFQWDNSSLADTGGTITWINAFGYPESLTYDDELPWSQEANGNGASLVYCQSSFLGSSQVSQPIYWEASQNNTGIVVNGITIYADPGEASYCSTVGVAEGNKPMTIQAYPNPTNNQVQIDLGSTKEITAINTYNSLGELVHKENRKAIGLIDYVLPNPKGVYLIQLVHTAGNTTNLKVIKE